MSIWDYVDEVLAPGDGATAGRTPATDRIPDAAALARLTRHLLVALGEDPSREGLVETPERVARSLQNLTVGYRQSLEEVVGDAVFAEDYNEMVLVRDIGFYSLCEHHLLPIIGRAHLAYLPDRCVVGLSKLPRIVEMYARRLQVQERLTREIAEAVDRALRPRGVGVVVEAEHLCMSMRGVQKPGTRTVTSCVLGEIDSDSARRAEFLSLVRDGR
jgi:GTP cyclohydrolase I